VIEKDRALRSFVLDRLAEGWTRYEHQNDRDPPSSTTLWLLRAILKRRAGRRKLVSKPCLREKLKWVEKSAAGSLSYKLTKKGREKAVQFRDQPF
jgi:hypothetical protein